MGYRRVGAWAVGLLVLGLATAGILSAEPEREGGSAPAPSAGAAAGLVERVIDGDTLVARIDGVSERVRLLGIDAPELPRGGRPGEYLAAEAAALARGLAQGKEVELLADPSREDRDDYGRLLRYVFLPDGRLLNAELVRAGHAHVFTRYRFAREQEFQALESGARQAAIGLWEREGLAEVDWNLAQGVQPVRLHATAGRTWAVECDGWTRAGLRAGDLPRELGRLRSALAGRSRQDLVVWLREAGYVHRGEAAR